MIFPIFSLISLIAIISVPASAAEVTIQPGETLSDIADRYRVSIHELKLINGINDENKIPSGLKLKLPKRTNQNNSLRTTTHKISKGESISSISKKYGVSQSEILSINSISPSDYLQIGQNIQIPLEKTSGQTRKHKLHKVLKGENLEWIARQYDTNPLEIAKLNNLTINSYIFPGQLLKISSLTPQKDLNKDKVDSNIAKKHIVIRGETLSSISKQYKIDTRTLIAINNIANPNHLNEGDELLLTENVNNSASLRAKTSSLPESSNWRNYGPLEINWSKWLIMDSSFVAPTRHKNGQSLYIAVNCPLKKLNSTGKNGEWKAWNSPVETFEKKLLDDLCNSKKS